MSGSVLLSKLLNFYNRWHRDTIKVSNLVDDITINSHLGNFNFEHHGRNNIGSVITDLYDLKRHYFRTDLGYDDCIKVFRGIMMAKYDAERLGYDVELDFKILEQIKK